MSLPSMVRQVVDELGTLIAQRRAVIEIGRTAEEPLARGPEQAVRQIVYHVLRNAVEASPSGGLIRVAQHQRDGQVIIDVTDEGPGIIPGDFSKIMRRGFTTKPGSKGQGLADVEWRLAELRGGISWESPLRTGRGTCFTVRLPAAPPPQ
ncbi:MAG TPA: HAMP domain-containing sensor histidine kinase [Candidatus Acidoferrales bacterium]|nr:HAMP domain-containing sensor histidine kinase [Candidatus Acidoferrales bacterium]